MSENTPPQWAWERVREIMGYDSSTRFRHWSGYDKLALYVAAHEEAPVDPLLEEVQQIADFSRINLSAQPRIEDALLRALRRGIEIGGGK